MELRDWIEEKRDTEFKVYSKKGEFFGYYKPVELITHGNLAIIALRSVEYNTVEYHLISNIFIVEGESE